MDDPLRVGRAESVDHLHEDPDLVLKTRQPVRGAGLLGRRARLQIGLQRLPFHQSHRDIGLLPFRPDLVNRDDVGVLQRRGRPSAAQETLANSDVAAFEFSQRDVSHRLGVPGLVDGARRAFPEMFQQSIPSEGLAGKFAPLCLDRESDRQDGGSGGIDRGLARDLKLGSAMRACRGRGRGVIHDVVRLLAEPAIEHRHALHRQRDADMLDGAGLLLDQDRPQAAPSPLVFQLSLRLQGLLQRLGGDPLLLEKDPPQTAIGVLIRRHGKLLVE